MPTAAAVGPALAEDLRLKPADFEKQRTIGIGVGVGGDLPRSAGLRLLFRREVATLLELGQTRTIHHAPPNTKEVEHPAAFAGLVVEPSSLAEVDRHTAVCAETELGLR